MAELPPTSPDRKWSAAARGTALPMVLLALFAPTLAVAQFRALALAVTVGLAATVLAHRRALGVWPWPRGRSLVAALGLLGWLAISAAWAAEPGRALATAASLGGFVLLGAAAARALAGIDGVRILRAAAIGLALAGALAAIDQLSGHALRAAVRGLAQPTPTLGFGLKPAASLVAVLLPVVLFAPRLPRSLRTAVALAAATALWVIPAEAAKLAAVAGVGAALLGARFGARVVRGVALAVALAILVAPVLAAATLPRLPPLAGWPPSAAHRVLIWDFVGQRIAERPLLGWGGEAARTVPGGRDNFDAPTLERFGLDTPEARAWFGRPDTQRLPLHVHNMALQLWLELGAVGALLGAALAWTLGAAAARAPPAVAAGAYAAAATVGGLSFGLWQEWWWGALLLLACLLVAAGGEAEAKRLT